MLCENYKGKKLQFINIFFRTKETYKLHPQAPKHYVHFYGGELTYDDVFDQALKAAVWVNFKNEGMYSKFTLEKENQIVFEKEINKTKNGVEFFLEMYKGIDLKKTMI